MTLYDYIFSLPVVTEGPVLDCWTCLRMTTRCFRGEYCQGDGGGQVSRNWMAHYLFICILLMKLTVLLKRGTKAKIKCLVKD